MRLRRRRAARPPQLYCDLPDDADRVPMLRRPGLPPHSAGLGIRGGPKIRADRGSGRIPRPEGTVDVKGRPVTKPRTCPSIRLEASVTMTDISRSRVEMKYLLPAERLPELLVPVPPHQ